MKTSQHQSAYSLTCLTQRYLLSSNIFFGHFKYVLILSEIFLLLEINIQIYLTCWFLFWSTGSTVSHFVVARINTHHCVCIQWNRLSSSLLIATTHFFEIIIFIMRHQLSVIWCSMNERKKKSLNPYNIYICSMKTPYSIGNGTLSHISPSFFYGSFTLIS